MTKIYTLIFVILISWSGFCQGDDDIVNFTSAIRVNLSKFKQDQKDALEDKDLDRVEFLFDSLVQNQIIGSKFNFLKVRKMNGGKLYFKKVNKPIVIITHTDWLVKNKGELQALNKLAREYKKKVSFIFIYWNNKENARKSARKFNRNITVCYADEEYKYDNRIVKMMRNTLGFPTSYQITEKKLIMDVDRGIGKFVAFKTPLNKAKEQNYEYLKQKLSPILQHADSIYPQKKKRKFLFF
uniref:hypothetical protein n=1 Tax=Flavobacterium sp. TaxID=239 RepID=UPI004049CB7F